MPPMTTAPIIFPHINLVYLFTEMSKSKSIISGNSLELRNSSDDAVLGSIDLDDETLQMAERDRVIEARIKFSVHGMHDALIHKTPNPRTGPKAKKLAEPRWKTLLPLQ